MNDDRLDLVFGALADRTRRAILARLADGEASVNDLVVLVGLSQPAVSKHLKVLENAGLVSRSRQGQMRLSRLEAEPLKVVSRWIGTYQEYWSASFDRLDDVLRRAGERDPEQ
jgi:DNA-binding transcriptional ArsR family regulator